MRKIITGVVMLGAFAGFGCADVPSPTPAMTKAEAFRKAELLRSYTWHTYNQRLATPARLVFSIPKTYNLREDSDATSSAQITIYRDKGRIEVFNYARYDDLPAPPDNPTPEQKKMIEEAVPAQEKNYGYNGDFFAYLFYPADDAVLKSELEQIVQSFQFNPLSLPPKP